MRRSSWMGPLLALGFFLGVTSGRAATGPGAEEARQPQADLAWFMVGLRDLCRSKDARLKLTPAQAKALLPELEALVDEGILPLEFRTPQGQRQVPGAPGQGSGGDLNEEERRAIQERRRRQAEKIEKAIERMEKVLRQAQSDYILNIEFDPNLYGLKFAGAGGDPGTWGQAELEKSRKTMEEGRRRLVQLNKEVLGLVKKLAR